jgi:excisionase family DNA binding protein
MNESTVIIQPTELYNVKEVADFLKTRRKFVYKLINDEKLDAIKLNGSILRVTGQNILDYLKNCEKKENKSEFEV